jgi:hypothetical protein
MKYGGVKIEARKMYFEIEMGWSKLLVPVTAATTTAVAALVENGLSVRSGWTEGNGSYLSPYDSEGGRIQLPSIALHSGEKVIDQLELAPQHRNLEAKPVNGGENSEDSESSMVTPH